VLAATRAYADNTSSGQDLCVTAARMSADPDDRKPGE